MNDEQADLVGHHCLLLIGCGANPAVVRQRNPTVGADGFKPLFVRCVGSKVIAMVFDGESSLLKNLRKLKAEVAAVK